jgi:glucose-6-phosphate 1-epimerase
MSEKFKNRKENGVVASAAAWKKSDSGRANHWTMRRTSLRGAAGAPVAPVAIQAKAPVPAPAPAPAAPAQDKSAKRRSITDKVMSLVGSGSASSSGASSSSASASSKAASASSKAASAGDAEAVEVSKVTIGDKPGLEGFQVVDKETGARIKVALFGGTLCSFRGADGKERLFHSSKTKTDKSKPVRGGVPVVFPVFGAAPKGSLMEQHGFARTSMWELVQDGPLRPHKEEGLVMVAMRLKSSAETLKQFKYKFELVHHIRFTEDELETSLNVTNADSSAFEFQAVLHTYLKVRGLGQATVGGLAGLSFYDKLWHVMPGDKPQVWRETSNALRVVSAVDNVYLKAQRGAVSLRSPADNTVAEVNMALMRGDEQVDCDLVLWNPGMAKVRRMADMDGPEFDGMLCIEPGCASRLAKCEPGQTWTVTQNLRFRKIDKYAVKIV